MRVRGNAHQVFDKYQALAREAATSGDRIAAEAYWQYADHYYRLIQAAGGFTPRNNQGWGDGEEGQPPPQQGQGGGQPQGNDNGNGNGNGNGHGHRNPQGDRAPREDGDSDPGLGGVAFLQNGRSAPSPADDPSMDDQPEVPEFAPAGGRGRG